MSNKRTILVIASGVAIVAVITFLTHQYSASSLVMPRELFHNNPQFGSGLFANTDYEMSWVGYDTESRKVVVTRNKRADASIPYGPQDIDKQVLSVSFDISAIAVGIHPVPSIDNIFVAGTDPSNGLTRVEQWKFSYGNGSAGGLGAGPTESRSTLYSGTSLGYIRAMDVDPQQRYLLILSYDGDVYRLDVPPPAQNGQTPNPTPPVLVADTSTVPSLAQARKLDHFYHVTDGTMFLATSYDPSANTIVFPDADDDGALEAPQVYTASQWQSSEYFDLENYVPLFKTEWFPGPN